MFSNYCFTRAINQLTSQQLELHHLLHPPHTENKRMFQIKIDLIIAHFTSGSVFFLLLNNIIANMVEINVIIKSFDKY